MYRIFRTMSRSGVCGCQSAKALTNTRMSAQRGSSRVPDTLCGKGVGDLDWVIVREKLEGEYSGHGGRSHRGLPEEVAAEVVVFTRVGVTRIMRYAFRLAQARPASC